MADTIDNLIIDVSVSADKAVQNLTRLQNAIKPLGNASKNAAGGMQTMAASVKDAGTVTQKAGEQSGNAQKNIRGVGKDAENAGKAAKKGAAGLGSFWDSLKRIAFYRFVRSIIKGITDAFKTGITNMYHWSKEVQGADRTFSKSMDRMATSALYLKNSLGAMTAPLINSLVPVLDVIIDKVVEVINFFNMLISAISGADTYTVAKKAATEWDKAASKTSKAAKELRRTLLGFDEINRLNGNTTSSSSGGKDKTNYEDMFTTKPLEGIFKKISDVTKGWPDWLKWLLGIGGAGLAAWGLSQLPKLIGNVLDWLKKLFTIKIPDWFRWLFGPKGNKDIDLKLPEDFGLPDADITTNIKKGDWSALDDLSGKPVYLSPKLDNKPQVLLENFKDDWDKAPSRTLYLSPKMDNSASVLYALFKRAWDEIGSKILYFSPRLNNSAKVLYDNFKKDWDNSASKVLYCTPKLDNKADVLWDQFKKDWIAVRDTLFASPKLDNTATVLWGRFKDEWMAARTTLYATPKLDNYGSVIFNKFKSEWNGANPVVTAFVQLAKSGWSTISGFVGTQVTVAVHLSRGNFYSLQSWVGTWTPVEIWLQRGNFLSLEDWLGDEIWVKVNLYMGSGGYLVDGQSRSFGGGSTSGGGAGRGRKALGGILSNGIWQNIPQYAGGTSNAHGSLFLAGEAGPEVVGHVGGRTEVLNKSQLASSIYSAVQSAMAPAAANFAYAAQALSQNNASTDYGDMYSIILDAVSNALSNDSNKREQTQLLRSINAKDTTVEVTTSAINKAQTRMNRRAGVTIAPVGT